MKKSTFFLATKQTAVFTLCGLLPLIAQGQQRSKEEIQQIISEFCQNKTSISVDHLQLRELSTKIVTAQLSSKASEAFYIYTSKGNSTGFVIVSADRRMPRILGYSETTSFDVEHIPANVKYWLGTYVETYSQLEDTPAYASTSTEIGTKPEGVSPLLRDIQWHQEEPFNSLCPQYNGQRSVTGCVATGMAQVMKYYEYPKRGTGVCDYFTDKHHLHIVHNLSEKDFQWDLMRDNYNGKYNHEEGNAVAELMYSCGASVKMDYSPNGSGAHQHDLVTAYIDNFYYDKDASIMLRDYCNTQDWHRILVKELNEGRPVNYGGTSFEGGHSFVFDGYRVSDTSTYPDYHVNWGWGGKCDGYYQIASLRPAQDGHPTMISGFSENQQMTIGIKPDDGISENTRVLLTSSLKASEKRVSQGDIITVSASTLCNVSYKDFSGEIAVTLIDKETGKIKGRTAYKQRRLTFLEDISDVKYKLQIPDSIPDGDYIIKLYSRCSNVDEWGDVYSYKYPTITISSDDDERPQDISPTILTCSELALSKGSDETTIKVQIFQLMNQLLNPFIGSLCLLLADENGRNLSPIGESVQTEELGYMQIQLNSYDLAGRITTEWPDGTYRLYVGVRQEKEDTYSFLKLHDETLQNLNEPSVLSYKVVKKGDEVVIEGHIYKCVPTDVVTPCKKSLTPQSLYTIDGHKQRLLRRGLYIIDGKIIVTH